MSTASHPPLTFRCLHGLEGLGALQSAWVKLLDRVTVQRFCHLPQWYEATLATLLDSPSDVWFVAAFHVDELVAICPLMFRMRVLGGVSVRCITSVEHAHLPFHDFVCDDAVDGDHLVKSLLGWLDVQHKGQWTLMDLLHIPARSLISSALRGSAASRGTHRADRQSFFLPCSGGYDAATANVARTFKRNLRRLHRRALERGNLSFEIHDTPATLPDALQEFIRIEASGWKGDAGCASAISCSQPLFDFYSNLVRSFGAMGRCRINLLRLNGQCVAAQFCLLVGGTLSILKIGYCQAHQDVGPGNLLMERTLRAACQDSQVHTLSFVTDPAWGQLWKPQSEATYRYRIYSESWRALPLLALARAGHFARSVKARESRAITIGSPVPVN